jgi:DNA repair exonuclease SbcCD ATPase subunit
LKTMLRSLTFSDFGPFEGTKTFNFDGPGTYAICASNGQGKSHVVLGAKMTSSPSCRLDKPMGAYINGLGLKARSAKVVAVYRVGDEDLEVTRKITYKKLPPEEELKELLAAGGVPDAGGSWGVKYKGESIRSSSDVTELLVSLFGVENTIQEDAVFVMQNKAGEVIDATPAARSKIMQYLSGAEICQKTADIAQRKLANLHVVDRSEELDEKEEKLENLTLQIADLESSIADLRGNTIQDSDIEQTRRRLTISEEAKARVSEYPIVKKQLADLEAEQAKKQEARDAKQSECESLNEDLDALGDQVVAARKYIASHEANMSLVSQYNRLLGQIEDLEKEADGHLTPEEPPVPREDIETYEDAVAGLERIVSNAHDFLKVFESTGSCPTCGSTPENVGELIVAKKQDIDDNEPKLRTSKADLSDLRNRWSKYDSDAASYKEWQAGWNSRVSTTADQLEKLGEIPDVDEGKLKEAQELVDAYSTGADQMEALSKDVAALGTSLTNLAIDISATGVQVSELAAASEKVLHPDEISRMEALLTAHKESTEALSLAEGTLAAKNDQLEELEREVKNLRESQAKNANKLKVQEFLESIKSVMHHSAIPHDRALVYLESMNSLMNDYCSVLHAPFGLFVDPETQYFLGQSGGSVSPAYQLSGGQRTLAAWAWHLSLYDKHGSQVGFMFMDEPTTGLDSSNLSNVGDAVRHLTKYCHGSGMQFIMVTHEESLASVFDKVVRI